MINEKGCIQAGEEWMERNLLAIASGVVGTAFAQVHVSKACISISTNSDLRHASVNFQQARGNPSTRLANKLTL